MTRTAAQNALLDRLQQDTFRYFLEQANPENGLVQDKTAAGSPSSIAAVGLGLACYAVAAERGFLARDAAARRVRTALGTLWEGEQSESPCAMGYRGFFYHFLDMETGRRAMKCEISTIDSAFLFAGALAAGVYFDGDDPVEREVRDLADRLYRRADWQWALNGGVTVSHGWKPETGFISYRWMGYNEAIVLYALALGSPTSSTPKSGYATWTESYRWKKLYGIEFLYGGPLFVHQASHVWIEFRGIQDEFMRAKGIDYFENSRRATYIQQQYGIRNPREFEGYDEFTWGITASDGPGTGGCPTVRRINGVERKFWDYRARGVPWGPDDGTISPWAVVTSLPFAPEIVLPTLEKIDAVYPDVIQEYGYRCSFNPTYRDGTGSGDEWISKEYYGIDQGPIVLMIENDRNGLLWRLMKRSPYIVTGLRRAGFAGGWLDTASSETDEWRSPTTSS